MNHERKEEFCAQDMPLTLQVTKTAKEWAEEFGVKWCTVRQRRYRGWPWTKALDPHLRKTTFNRGELR